jgi:serine/threonine protein kinase/Flp pilus assembly protein TadD
MTLTAGTRLGPYEILAPLGAGGMGEVYRAKDTKLGRDVALKVLPGDFLESEEGKARFEREARALAALNHPNIAAIYSFEEISGRHLLVMELLEGETLRERLAKGPLPQHSAVEIGVEIARGLAAAHAKGIVHRDLKPANAFVTSDGVVKILDFGLAKLTRPEAAVTPDGTTMDREPRTESGTVLGTMGYTSPEQLRGEQPDARTDIFAFGCVLYEMLSGKSPFLKATGAETVTAIMSEDPPPLSGTGRVIAPALNEIVKRCLEKRPGDRFSSAHDLALALRAFSGATETPLTPPVVPAKRRWRRLAAASLSTVALFAALLAGWMLVSRSRKPKPGATTKPPLRIVVLPFENLGSPEDAYFASGMTEEITSRLANVRTLAVISRTSATQYDRKGKTVEQIGKDLGVSYVLEGSVRYERSGAGPGRVRITPQLIRVTDDTHVWADRYERVIADVFTIQSEVAENTVKAMGVALLPRERTALKEVSTNDMEAYDLYLRGKELASRGAKKTDFEGAVQMYQAALDRDPHFAQALAGLARMHLSMHWFYFDRSPERLVKAKEAAERAVELRPDLAASHAALGWYFYWGRLDYPPALSEYSAALKIQPNSSDALLGTAAVLRRQGRWAEAVEAIRKAPELDPKNPELLFEVGYSFLLVRRYAEADRAFGLAIALSPQWAEPYAEKAGLQVDWHGDLEKSQAVLDEAGKVAGLADDEQALAGARLELTLARRDYPGALRQLEAEARNDNMSSYSPIPLLRGQVQRLAGQDDLARRSFETARQDLEQKIREDPDDPRFHSSLGIAYAGLGRRLEAVRESKRGCDLMPASKDALRAIDRLWDLALVYTMVGQTSEAIALLDSMAQSGRPTSHRLRLDPNWDPLRSNPRFQALLTKYEVKP